MNPTPYFLPRKEHDLLLDTNQPLLQRMFNECASRQWSLAGVEFTGLSEDLIIEVVDATCPDPEDAPGYVEFPKGEFNPAFIY